MYAGKARPGKWMSEKLMRSDQKNWRKALRAALPDADLRFDEAMAKHTTFQVGGPADALLLPKTSEEIVLALSICKNEDCPVMVMGKGSNLLVRDGGIRGLVIQIDQNMNEMRFEGKQVWAEAGCRMSSLVQELVRRNLSGLEFAGGIPASVGGAVAMNAGAYGGSVSDCLKKVRYLDENLNLQEREIQEGDMAYRKTIFGDRRWIVLEACFELREDLSEEPAKRLEEYNRQRREKQPLSYPSAGSVFKRPPGHFAGKLIEDAGCKGLRIGGAEVSTLHAGFIINRGGASAKDIEALICEIQKRVYEQSGVQLETEVKRIGEED